MNFEKQLEKIAHKDELHKWVDSLPDESRGLILIELLDKPEDERATVKYMEFGEITIAEAIYLLRSYEHWVFGDMHP